MICCLNPDCTQPLNYKHHPYCQNCGAPLKILLRNRYKILKPLGRGGFGKTYLARDIDKFDELCVVKQLAPQAQGSQISSKVKDLFHQEAQQLKLLGEHPQIPYLQAYFHENNYFYLTQQFIAGEDLRKKLKHKGVFSETQIRELLLNLLPVLGFIHDRGIVHRDLKPENIICCHYDGNYVLIDFGIAKVLNPFSKDTSTSLGSLGYAAPEQIVEGKATPASDLFSLGVSCFHLLSGVHPKELFMCNGYSWVERWNNSLDRPVSQNFAKILSKLLQKDTNKRYQKAEQALEDLENPENGILTKLDDSIPSNSMIIDIPQLNKFEFETITVDSFGNTIDYARHQTSYYNEELDEKITLDMVSIPGGDFLMGSKSDLASRSERPQHKVKVESFFMSKFPITQAQWAAIAALPQVNRELNLNPSEFTGDNRPVENVSWYDAVEFCQRLSRETGRKYRLPSEAEWEYACRAGTDTPFYFGETITADLANYDSNYAYASETTVKYRGETTPVGIFPPNAFGLYDMHGLVYEWCIDTWHKNYQGAPDDGSAWLDLRDRDLSFQVLRGGSWLNSPSDCRCACRDRLMAQRSNTYEFVGFRVVCSIDSNSLSLSGF
ncbi:MAG: SUMF1/EgtB/PvdO family nonheme iron enzyme [Prochloraceae cyanobacterium]